jgi:hypothetical protein
VIARKGDEQELRQIGADQPVKTVGNRRTIVEVQCRAVGHQQAWPAGKDTVMGCGAHARDIGGVRGRLNPWRE